MHWKDANKYKPKKHPKNSYFSINVIISFGTDILDEPDVIGYYDFINDTWMHDNQYYRNHPVAFLEYPEFEGL